MGNMWATCGQLTRVPVVRALASQVHPVVGVPAGGIFVTDVTNASRTGLMDLASLRWHEPALRYFNVPADALPQIRSNAEAYGTVASGPLAGVPITGARPKHVCA